MTLKIPVLKRVPALELVFVGLAFLAGCGAMLGAKTRVITHNVTTVRSPYTHPDQTVNGAQVNSQLAGFTCDFYTSQRTMVCHP